MTSIGMKGPAKQPAPRDGSGLVLFDEYLNDEDFLEFLIEWSDSIVQKGMRTEELLCTIIQMTKR